MRNGGNGSARDALRLMQNIVLRDKVCLRNYESHA